MATLRSGETPPDAISALWREGFADRIDLAPLSPDAVASLLAAVLGGPVEGATVAHLAARSGGNALFLREVVVGAMEAGTIREEGGTWHLVGELTPSRRLTETVEAHAPSIWAWPDAWPEPPSMPVAASRRRCWPPSWSTSQAGSTRPRPSSPPWPGRDAWPKPPRPPIGARRPTWH